MKSKRLAVAIIALSLSASSYNLTPDTTRSGIYWSEGDLTSETLNYYLSNNGYATNALTPVTSGPFSSGGTLALKTAPSYLTPASTTVAPITSYVRINFVFRVTKLTDGTQFNVGDIYLKDFGISGAGTIQQTTRAYFESNAYTGLLNPSSASNGSTAVGGLLDLNSDGYFDYSTTVDGEGNIVENEYVYGSYNNSSNSSVATTGTGKKSFTGSCFDAAHKDGTYPAVFSANYASYLGTSNVVNNDTVLAKIESTTSVADLVMTLYVEGWDHASSNTTSGQRFSLVMDFESD